MRSVSVNQHAAPLTRPRRSLSRDFVSLLGGLAEFERELIRTRTGEGRARGMTRGAYGSTAKLTTHQKREALNALADGTASQADWRVASMLARRQYLGAR